LEAIERVRVEFYCLSEGLNRIIVSSFTVIEPSKRVEGIAVVWMKSYILFQHIDRQMAIFITLPIDFG
jgi:hypothetical protein